MGTMVLYLCSSSASSLISALSSPSNCVSPAGAGTHTICPVLHPFQRKPHLLRSTDSYRRESKTQRPGSHAACNLSVFNHYERARVICVDESYCGSQVAHDKFVRQRVNSEIRCPPDRSETVKKGDDPVIQWRLTKRKRRGSYVVPDDFWRGHRLAIRWNCRAGQVPP